MEKKQRAFLVIKYGAFTCAIALLFSFLLPMIGASMGIVQNVIIVVLGAEMYFCCNEYKQKTQESLVFKDAFALGWQVSFFAGLINAILVFVAVKIMGETEMLKAMMVYKEMFVAQGLGKEETVETMIKTMINPWFLFVMTNVFYLVLGFFLSVINGFLARTPQLSQNEE